mmetsp:Transcript_42340/g.102005  ORF Transcript_42340/g.102005 Transcript_42340/m.102005 type:complete len:208 (-) Transcript_42340:1308-1931(-)
MASSSSSSSASSHVMFPRPRPDAERPLILIRASAYSFLAAAAPLPLLFPNSSIPVKELLDNCLNDARQLFRSLCCKFVMGPLPLLPILLFEPVLVSNSSCSLADLSRAVKLAFENDIFDIDGFFQNQYFDPLPVLVAESFRRIVPPPSSLLLTSFSNAVRLTLDDRFVDDAFFQNQYPPPPLPADMDVVLFFCRSGSCCSCFCSTCS